MRSDQYMNGFREASKLAVALLHAEANSMNDPRAKAVLDSAAHMVGVQLRSNAMRGTATEDDQNQ